MKFPRSKSGWLLAGLYFLFCLYFWYKAVFASSGWGLESLGYFLLPSFPWVFLFQYLPDNGFIGMVLYAVFIILNLTILYKLGALLGNLFDHRNKGGDIV